VIGEAGTPGLKPRYSPGLKAGPTPAYQRWLKRVLDVLVCLLSAPISLPLLATVGLLVRLFVGKPTFFSQLRPGLHGRPFTFIKFRTMSDERDREGRLLPDVERLRPFGRFLRSVSLDELPELWNVLRGNMSLVGPRPLLMQYLPCYTPEQARRHEVRPGLTGWAQINGRNTLTWEQKFERDVWYVDNVSFWLDLRIMTLTAWKLLKREGISQPGQATMLEFTGSTTGPESPSCDRT
jgi:sugar transferase EpsL